MFHRPHEQIMQNMYESAQVLADSSDGLFCAYEPDRERFDYHSVSRKDLNHKSTGQPIADVDQSDSVASIVDHRYSGLTLAIEEHDKQTGVITQIGNVLRSGQNVSIGLEHGELIDVAMAEVGISNALRRRKIAHRSGMIVSKAIDFMGIRVDSFGIPPDVTKTFLAGLGMEAEDDGTVPVRKFLGLAADTTYLTIPSSKTFANIRRSQEHAVKSFNEKTIELIERDMKGGEPMLLCVAVPGTTVKILDSNKVDTSNLKLGDDGDSIEVIGKISHGITRFMKNALTYATAVRLGESPVRISINKDFLCVQDPEDVDFLANRLVDVASELEPGKRFIYDKNGDLPVVRK